MSTESTFSTSDNTPIPDATAGSTGSLIDKSAHRRNLQAAQNRLKSLQEMADLRWQAYDANDGHESQKDAYKLWMASVAEPLTNDINTPEALAVLSQVESKIKERLVAIADREAFELLLTQLETTLGLSLFNDDISKEQKALLSDRQQARDKHDWTEADKTRDKLKEQGIGVRDTEQGQIWFRV